MSAVSEELPLPRSGRDWLIDITCFGLAVAFGVGSYWLSADLNSASPTLLALDLITGVASCLALWWRRRWPTEIALAVAAASAFSQLSTGAALVMLFTVAVHRSLPAVIPVALVNIVAGYLLLVVRPDPESLPGEGSAISALIVVAIVAWGMYRRARRQLVSSLRERAERAETEQELRVDQARQRERTRIAREMHDVLGHRISLISMHAGALEVRAEAAGDEILESAAIIRASAHQALEDLREVIGVLSSETDDQPTERPQPTLGDLSGLVEESQRAGMNVTFHFIVPEDANPIPASVGRTAYRVVQEGLTNARKHAQGSAVLVQVNGGPGAGLSVEVRNRRPVGSSSAPRVAGTGRGLVGLAERASLVGGRLDHGRTPDGDFLIQSWLPWSAWQIPEPDNQDV